jgi:serine/threonine protein kinase
MSGGGGFLIGKIALREGLITKEQLYDALVAQERNPAKTLGQIFVSRGYLKNEDVERLLALQRKAIEDAGSASAAPHSGLLGRILIEKGLATEYHVNECLRLQGRLIELGISPVPQLGEILVKRGYVKRSAVDAALQMQNLSLYSCPECGAHIELPPGESRDDIVCPGCRAEVPFLFAKMAAAVREALDKAAAGHDVDVPADVREAARDPKNQFGKYVLVKEVGRGGAGIVYRAWQKDFNKIVALKLLPHESDTAAGIKTPYGDAEDVKRFYNETRAAAELSHPNIVPILDFGTVENHFFYTMPFVEGVTLDGIVREGVDESVFQTTYVAELGKLAPGEAPQLLKGKQLPLKLTLALMRDVAKAVDYAHERGIYHRDIKPANIIIDAKGRPWVMDFGLAKVARIGDSAYVKGVIMGTPYYMPPEQASGDMEKVDAASDIYSVGAVLYELVTGYCPYAGKAPDEVLSQLPRESPEPVEMLAPGAPEEAKLIIRKAMARDKRDRYPRALHLAEDLQRALDGRPLQEEPIGAMPRSFWGKIRGLFGPS